MKFREQACESHTGSSPVAHAEDPAKVSEAGIPDPPRSALSSAPSHLRLPPEPAGAPAASFQQCSLVPALAGCPHRPVEAGL